jgi:hypothetical protein
MRSCAMPGRNIADTNSKSICTAIEISRLVDRSLDNRASAERVMFKRCP